MKNTMKKIMSLVLTLIMVFSVVPMTDLGIEASAATQTSVKITTSGQVVDSFMGVQAKYIPGTGNSNTGDYCCAAYVKKFYSAVYGVDVWNLTTGQTPSAGSGSFSVTSSPEPGDIGYQTNSSGSGHWFIIKEVNSNGTYSVIEQNWKWASGGATYCYVNRNVSYSSTSGFKVFRWSKKTTTSGGGSTSSGSNNPLGAVDNLSGGVGIINVSGWAFDSDDTSASLNIHVYIGDEGHGWISANKERTDVNKVHGCGDYHGYAETIKTAKTGTQTVEIYAINVGGGANVLLHRGIVNIMADSASPKISNIVFRNSSSGFLVTCEISDNVGITDVVIPVWTENNGQDDAKFYYANLSTDKKSAWFQVDKINHNNETGIYRFDVYAYDTSGNYDKQGTFSTYVGNLVQFWWISNPDNSDTYIDASGTPTISGVRKFWFKEWDEDTNYYLDIYVDGQKVISNSPSDNNGYISYVIDTGTMEDGLHTIKAVLADTQTAYTDTKEFYVNNLVRFHGISTSDNSTWYDSTGTPSISGVRKFWFKKESTDTNYYFDLYIDGVKKEGNRPADANDWYSYTFNTAELSNGTHTIRAELFDSKSYYTATKTFIINNPSYTVSLNANGGSCSTTSKSVTYSSTYGTLPIPTRGGYTFNGWYTASSGGSKVTSSTIVSATNNHTLYAQWTCNHNSTEVRNAKTATCTATGYTGDTYCKTCGTKTKTGTTTAKTAHNSNTKIPAVAATCTKTGLTEGKKCSVCGTITVAQQTVAKKAHTEVIDKAVSATCAKTGLTQGKHCSVCGIVTVAQQTVSVVAHIDNNTDYNCDYGCGYRFDKPAPEEPTTPDTPDEPTKDCSCNCHKGGLAGLFFKIINFFQKLFGMNKVCACGVKH